MGVPGKIFKEVLIIESYIITLRIFVARMQVRRAGIRGFPDSAALHPGYS